MTFSVGEMLGGAIAVLLLSFIIEMFLFKNEEPTIRATKTVGAVLIFSAILSGFGKADGGSFVWTAGLTYVPGAIAVFLWFRYRYASKWIGDTDG